MASRIPTTITALLASAVTTSPLQKVVAAMVWARVWAFVVLATASSMRAAVRAWAPYARITGAPTTDSDTALSISPIRSRTPR